MLLLVIGVVVTEISVWGRRQQAAASRRAGYLDGLNGAARAVAVGGSPSALAYRRALDMRLRLPPGRTRA